MVAADLDDLAANPALVARDEHGHALAGKRRPRHLALHAVIVPAAVFMCLTRPYIVDLLAHLVATRQRRWRLGAYLSTFKRHRSGVVGSVRDGLGDGGPG